MIHKSTIKKLVEEKILLDEMAIFLVDIKISTSNQIYIILDSDTGVKIHDCKMISRYVESNLDREQEDFELEVSSYGLDRPLVLPRQYIKYINKQIKITLNSDDKPFNATILSTTESDIEVSIAPAKKQKNAEPTNQRIPYTAIKEAKLIITF